MRGNSGFIRWTAGVTVVMALVMLAAMPSTVNAGPARTRRMMRDVFASQETDPVAPIEPQQDSQDTCTDNGKEVLRSSVQCEIQTGCRKIEKRGECCPIYQCDCEVDGTTYKNGAKVITHLATTPCHVCLCRGGEIKCTNVTCYSRNDCGNTTYIDGVCCPEYNDCPPIEDVHFSGSKDSFLSTESSVSPSSSIVPPRLVASTTTTSAPASSEEPVRLLDPDNPLGIKIKEITKPEEIRITDDKPKPFKPPIRTSSEVSAAIFEFPIHEDVIEEEGPSSGAHEQPTDIRPEDPAVDDAPTVNDHVDDLTPLENPEEGFLNEEAGVKNVRQTEQSTASEEPLAQSEVVVSDKLLAIATSTDGSGDLLYASSTPSFDADDLNRKSTTDDDQSSRIVIVDGQEFKVKSADGLQLGVDEEDDRKSGRKSNGNVELIATTVSSGDDMIPSSTTEALFVVKAVDAVYYDPATEGSLSKEIFDDIETRTMRPLTSAEIISIYEQESMLKHSTKGPKLTSEEIIAKYEESLFKQSTEGPFDGSGMSVVGTHVNDQFTEEPEVEGSSSDESIAVSTTVPSSSIQDHSTAGPVETTSEADDTIEDRDKNPEFPEQLDDYSVHSQMQEEEAKSRGLSAALVEQHSTSGPSIVADELAVADTQLDATTAGPLVEASSDSSRDQHNFSDVQERSPGEPFLIPEWERNTTTPATKAPKFDRKDSLILLPVNDPIVRTYEEHSSTSAAPVPETESESSSVPSSSVATSIELELDDDPTVSGSTEHLLVVNEVASAESRNAGDDFSFADQLFGNSKLNKFYRMSENLLKYRERFMNS